MDATIRQDDVYVYCDVFDAEPLSELYIELHSTPVDPNPSTEGVTPGMHKTVKGDGTCTFKAPIDFILPDLPRKIVFFGPIADKTFT